MVVQASGNDALARLALGELCQIYWYPLYAFLRRRGLAPEDAEDTVQAFFAWLLEADVLGRADPNRGRFRSFLLAALKQFLARQHQYQSAAKRSPDRPLLSIDTAVGSTRYRTEPADPLTPEKQFEYAWARAVLDRSLERLQNEARHQGGEERFETLKGFLTGRREVSGREVAHRLGLSEGAVRVAIHRLKQRYGAILREEVGSTLETADAIDEELVYLMNALKL